MPQEKTSCPYDRLKFMFIEVVEREGEAPVDLVFLESVEDREARQSAVERSREVMMEYYRRKVERYRGSRVEEWRPRMEESRQDLQRQLLRLREQHGELLQLQVPQQPKKILKLQLERLSQQMRLLADSQATISVELKKIEREQNKIW